ncbi:WYL domain-containing protein [Tessaracoccus rhinocerotis]|uniref:WYL domain-containing protein n=2 Tax=Tessaracoccus rhinocerotis TaxID=1689449 RepID=A0A553JVZ8_9ACTN|nr:WYL domain-containing protein [Tessaracoccus rhinocerotis]
MMANASQLERLLNLIPYLQTREHAEVSEVARHFGVTAKQVLADLEVLQFCGLPEGYYDDLFHVDLEGAREDGFISFRNAEVLTRPRRLRIDEASSLMLALEALLEISGGEDPHARSALAKLRGVLGDVDPAVSVDVAGGLPEHREALRRAIDEHRVVEITYTAQRSGPHRVEVEPVLLRVVDGATYLEGWSRVRDGWRSYRLDRMDDVSPTSEQFEPRADPPSAETTWFNDADQLTLGLDPRAAWVLEYFPVTFSERSEDHIWVTFPVGSREWATGLLLRLGAQVREVSDGDLAAAAAREAAAALDLYEMVGGTDAGDPPSSG